MQPDKSVCRTVGDGGLDGRSVICGSVSSRAIIFHVPPKRVRLRRVKTENVGGTVAVRVHGDYGAAVLNISGERRGVGRQKSLRGSVGVEHQSLRDAVEQQRHVRAEQILIQRIHLEKNIGVRIDKDGAIGWLDIYNRRRNVRDGDLHPVVYLVTGGFMAEKSDAVYGSRIRQNAVQHVKRPVRHAVLQD